MIPSASADAQRPATDSQDQKPALCATVEDFFTPPARQILNRLMAPFLIDQSATAIEVLHNPRLQQALEATPLRRTLADRLAEAQAPLLGVPLKQRSKELEALFGDLFGLTRTLIKQSPPTELKPATFAAALSDLRAEKSAFDGAFTINASLTLALQSCRDRLAKIETLLDFAEALLIEPASPSIDAAIGTIDTALGEHLAIENAARLLWSDQPPLNIVLTRLLDLYRNEGPGVESLPATMGRLRNLLVRHPMPGVRAGLIEAVQHELHSSERMVPSVEGDLLGQKALLADLMATAEIAKRLKQQDRFFGGKRTHDLLDRRVSMLISTEKLQEVLRGKSVVEKLNDLFHLQIAVASASSTKPIDEYILFLMESRDFTGRVFDAVDKPEARLQTLANLQKRVLVSTLPDDKRRSLALMLDAAQMDHIKTTSLFSNLRRDRPSLDTILEIVDLCGIGAFTEGKCVTEARELVRRHVRRKDFVRKYLHSLDPDGDKSTGNLATAIEHLTKRLDKAGIAFRDLSQLTILVVEDEESARSYIDMVLRDMGVQKVMTAQDGRAGLEVFSDFEDGIDLIICDWNMPRMSGLDFLKQVRSVKPKLPFLMVTGLATEENVQAAIAHDVTGYIAKPFPPEQLEEKVLLLMGRAMLGDDEKG